MERERPGWPSVCSVNAVKPHRFLLTISLLALAACGSRQSSQSVAQPTAQPAAQPPAQPSQPVAATVPQQAGQPSYYSQSPPPAVEQAKPPAVGEAVGEAPPPERGPEKVLSPAREGRRTARYERVPSSPAPAPLAPERRRVTLPAGTALRVRLDETLDTRQNRPGDPFVATLYEPVAVNGEAVIPRGTRFRGHLVESKASGRFKGRALMSLSLDSFQFGGRSYTIETSRFSETSGRHKKRNLVLIGGGGGTGAAIGAIAAGPAGALIGAGAGAAAGTAGAAITGKKHVHIPVETRVVFTLRSPVEINRS